jgi:hypothetical protein
MSVAGRSGFLLPCAVPSLLSDRHAQQLTHTIGAERSPVSGPDPSVKHALSLAIAITKFVNSNTGAVGRAIQQAHSGSDRPTITRAFKHTNITAQ